MTTMLISPLPVGAQCERLQPGMQVWDKEGKNTVSKRVCMLMRDSKEMHRWLYKPVRMKRTSHTHKSCAFAGRRPIENKMVEQCL